MTSLENSSLVGTKQSNKKRQLEIKCESFFLTSTLQNIYFYIYLNISIL